MSGNKGHGELPLAEVGSGLRLMIGGAVLALAVWVAWGLWGAKLFQNLICGKSTDCGQLGQVGDIFGGINALFAAFGLAAVAYSTHRSQKAFEEEQRNSREAFEVEQESSRQAFEETQRSSREVFEKQQQREFDVDTLEQVRRSYEWAYEVLVEDGVKGSREKRRLAWLTSARHLLRAEMLVASIKTPVYQTIQSEVEEYWRTKFHRALSDPQLSKPSFYFDANDNQVGPVEVSSALAVLAFSVWQEDGVDPVESVRRVELLEKRGVVGLTGAYRGVERYILDRLPHLRDVWIAYRASLSSPSSIDPPDVLAGACPDGSTSPPEGQ